MGHAWFTENGFRVHECRETEWVTPGLPGMVPVWMNVELRNGSRLGYRGWFQG